MPPALLCLFCKYRQLQKATTWLVRGSCVETATGPLTPSIRAATTMVPAVTHPPSIPELLLVEAPVLISNLSFSSLCQRPPALSLLDYSCKVVFHSSFNLHFSNDKWLSVSSELLLFLLWVAFAFSGGSVVKNPPTNAGDAGLIPGLRRSPGEGTGKPLQYSCLGNPMVTGA